MDGIPGGYQRPSSARSGAAGEIGNYVTDELRDAIHRKFKLDFEHFGYALE